ncbi:MAG: hypothetical protein KC731_18550 [Myxococcales bacterium]|nr:hypothetical protein [Myxococcales bacterium]
MSGEPQQPAVGGQEACRACGDALAVDAKFCDGCGARVLSDEEHYELTQRLEPQMAKGRTWIGAIAILYVLGGVVLYLMNEEISVLVVNFVLAAIQAGLWLWSKRSLLPAAITALVLYVSIQLLNAVLEPESIARGMLVKILFLLALGRAIQAGIEARRLTGARA